jgi:hypothetical protein
VQASWQLGTGEILTIASNFGAAGLAWDAPSAPLLYGEAAARGTLPAHTTLAFLEAAA